MRSGELAALAGVTPRAIRHYHQVGVLPEPERRANGYRTYAPEDLVRLLRIKRLAALGVPLERMTAVLDGDGSERGALLDELEQAIDAEIARLREQRDLVRAVRTADAAPDLPPGFSEIVQRYVAAGVPEDIVRIEREHGVLLAHLAGDGRAARFAEVYGRLITPELLTATVPLAHAFEALDDDPDPATVDAVVARYRELLGPVLVALRDGAVTTIGDELPGSPLFDAYAEEHLTTGQRQVLDRIAAFLEAPER